jgi:hypothetical protein
MSDFRLFKYEGRLEERRTPGIDQKDREKS